MNKIIIGGKEFDIQPSKLDNRGGSKHLVDIIGKNGSAVVEADPGEFYKIYFHVTHFERVE